MHAFRHQSQRVGVHKGAPLVSGCMLLCKSIYVVADGTKLAQLLYCTGSHHVQFRSPTIHPCSRRDTRLFQLLYDEFLDL